MEAETYKIEWSGPMLSDYFQGAGTSYTPWNDVATGCGPTIEEAYADAIEFAYQGESELSEDAFPEWEASELPALGLEDFGLDPEDEECESLFFVSIYYDRKA